MDLVLLSYTAFEFQFEFQFEFFFLSLHLFLSVSRQGTNKHSKIFEETNYILVIFHVFPS